MKYGVTNVWCTFSYGRLDRYYSVLGTKYSVVPVVSAVCCVLCNSVPALQKAPPHHPSPSHHESSAPFPPPPADRGYRGAESGGSPEITPFPVEWQCCEMGIHRRGGAWLGLIWALQSGGPKYPGRQSIRHPIQYKSPRDELSVRGRASKKCVILPIVYRRTLMPMVGWVVVPNLRIFGRTSSARRYPLIRVYPEPTPEIRRNWGKELTCGVRSGHPIFSVHMYGVYSLWSTY